MDCVAREFLCRTVCGKKERQLELLERWGRECQAEAAALHTRSMVAEEIAREAEGELRRRSADEFDRLRGLEAELQGLQAETIAPVASQAELSALRGGGGRPPSAHSRVWPRESRGSTPSMLIIAPKTSGRILLRPVLAAWHSAAQHTWLVQSLFNETAAAEQHTLCARAVAAWRFAAGRGRLLAIAAELLGHHPGHLWWSGLRNPACRALARIMVRIWAAFIALGTSSAEHCVETPPSVQAAADEEAPLLTNSFMSPPPAFHARALPLFGTPRRVRAPGGGRPETSIPGSDDGFLPPTCQRDFAAVSSRPPGAG